MKAKLFNVLLIITSLLGFLKWGHDHQMFLFQIEAEIFSKILKDPLSVAHPFVLLPAIGQILLLVTLIQKQPSKTFTYIGIGGIGILMLLIFLIGCLTADGMILFSSVPFLTVAYFTIQYHRKSKIKKEKANETI